MDSRLRLTFLALIVMQAIHSVEEFIFGFYERFPPMKFVYQDAPNLAKPAFVVFNALLIFTGLFCFYHWVRPARKGAKLVVWVSITIESFNVMAHVVWAILVREYNPGLVSGILFVPIVAYLSYLVWIR
jgi:hypothetical protein